MMSIELGILIAILASFGLGVILGRRGKSALREELGNVKARFRATDRSLAQALDDIRRYRYRDEQSGESIKRSAEVIERQEKLLARIKEALERHRMTYDDIYGWLKPIAGNEYRYDIEITRLPADEIEKMRSIERIAQTPPSQRQAAKPKAVEYSTPAMANQQHNAYYPRQDNVDNTVSAVTQAAVLASIMDNSHNYTAPEPVRCHSPSTDNDTFDTGSCSPTVD